MREKFAGRFLLLRRLGRGGMGEVFLARDLTTGTECALKRFAPRAQAGLAETVRREFEALTRVRHPALVSVYELGVSPDGIRYCTMEYVPGIPADRAVARGDWAALCFVGTQVAHGLEALNAAHVVHGDLKPANLLVVPAEIAGVLPRSVRLLDFGLAVLIGEKQGGHTGTPGYAAPEVVRGEPPSPASDLYGLGATLHAIATGRPAFEGDDVDAMLRRQQAGPPPALMLEEAGVPGSIVQLILRLMSPEKHERPRDAREVRRELERIHPAARRPLAERLQAAVVVGRERELAHLEGWLGSARTRRPAIVVTGEPGSGKSALLGELGARASLAGLAPIALSCGALEGPGAVARALLRRLAADTRGDAVRELASASARAVFTGAGASPREQDLDELASAAAGWAATIAERSGRILVLLDDAERLDPLSQAWVRRLVLRAEPAPIRWVWARRPVPDGVPEGESVLVETGYAERIELGALDREAVARLAAARLGDTVPAELVEFLWSRAGGHPGLTVEVLRAAATAGAIVEGDGGLRVDARSLEEVGIPRDFESSLAARFEALPPPARALAEALAVWGQALDPDGVRALAPEADAAASETLRDSGLARALPTGELLVWPPAFGERIVESLPAERRRELHGAALGRAGLGHAERFRHLRGAGDAAGALEAARAALDDEPDEGLAAAAAALAGAEAPAEAAAWHEQAARLIMTRRRYAAAVPHLERALELEPAGEARAERWAALCTCYMRSGRLDDAARAIETALKEGVPDALRARLMAEDAARLYYAGRQDEARERGEAAFALGEHARALVAIAMAAELLSDLYLRDGRIQEADTMAQRAAQAFEQAEHAHGRLRVYAIRARIARGRSQAGEAERILREGLTLARERRDRLALEDLLDSLGLLLIETGRWESAREVYEECVRITLEDGRGAAAAAAMSGLGQIEGLMGHQGPAQRHARAAVRLCRRHRPRTAPYALRSLAQAHRVAGKYRRAARLARRALLLANRARLDDVNWCRLELARAQAALGHWAAAEATAAIGPDRQPASNDTSALTILVARAALRNGRAEEAATRLAAVEKWLEGREAPFISALALLAKAELAFTSGQATEAVDAGRRALDLFAKLPAHGELAFAACDLARLARVSSSLSPHVVAWLDTAARGFERLGNHRGREAALALTVEWLRRPEHRAPVSSSDLGLIERVSWLLSSITDLRELAQRAMRMAVEQLDAERGVLLLVDRESGNLTVMAEHGAVDPTTRSEAVGYSRRAVERVTESGGSLLVSDAPSDPRVRSESVVNLQLRSIVCVPLFLGSVVVGAVYLDDSRRAHRFDEQDRGVLEGFAHLMAVAIEKARGHEEIERIQRMLEDENLALRQEVGTRFQYQNVVGTSSMMKRVLATVEHAARTSTTVLIAGENGTGKELIARTLHHGGKRRRGPFVVVNCGAIPETLLESELFGILPNVATGVRARDGRFVQASGGALFLDEIGEMPLKQQVALLSAIANGEITPVGGGKPIPVDVRIIAATNRDLRRLVEQGLFREDLYYRLNVLEIDVPPLRDRKSDIPALARHFLERFATAQERDVPQLSPDFMAVLMQSDWPGNVRELQNYVERVLAMNPGKMLRPDPLPRDLQDRGGVLKPGRGRGLTVTVGEIERRMVAEALQRADGNQSQAARLLGMTEQSLRYRIRKFGMEPARNNRRTRRK